MPIHNDLLEILVCPSSKVGVKILPKETLSEINNQIAHGKLKYNNGSIVDDPLEEGLITEDGKTIYIINDGIPIMLTDYGIPTYQLHNAKEKR